MTHFNLDLRISRLSNVRKARIVKASASLRQASMFRKAEDLLRRYEANVRELEAHYSKEFHDWGQSQGAVFTNPETGNTVRFTSLPSQEQSKHYQRWESGGYEDRGGPSKDHQTKRETKRLRDKARMKELKERIKELRPKFKEDKEEKTKPKSFRKRPKSKMSERSGLGEGDIGGKATSSIRNEYKGDKLMDALSKASYENLEIAQRAAEEAYHNPDGWVGQVHWISAMPEDALREFHSGVSKKLSDARGAKFADVVYRTGVDNGLEEEDALAILDFREDKPDYGRKLSNQELFNRFLNHPKTSQETKERMRKMDINEFMAMYNAILDDEDETELSMTKTSSLTLRGFQARIGSSILGEVRPVRKTAPLKAHQLLPSEKKAVIMAYQSGSTDMKRRVFAAIQESHTGKDVREQRRR